MSKIESWSETAASNNSASPDGWPENMSSAGLNDSAREMMAQHAKEYRGKATYADPTASREWLDITYGKTVARVSDTEITVASYDATPWAVAGRRIRILSASAQADGYVVSSSFSTNTTVTVLMDGASVPTSPTKLLMHVGGTLKNSAFTSAGSGNGLDADKVDGFHATQLYAALRNRIRNGDFQIWQRGTSFTADGVGADGWRITLGTGGAATVTRQAFTLGQTDVPGEPTYYMRWVHGTNSSSAPTLAQRVEGVRTLAGQSATVSFYAKAGGSLSVGGVLRQNFGTGGSPSSDVDTSLGSFSVTTSWARYTATVSVPSISGKTLGTAADFLELRLTGPTGATYTLEVADVQVEPGASATAYERRSFADELARCQRYFVKTFAYGTAPAQNAGDDGAIVTGAFGSFLYTFWLFPQPMRAVPTVTTYAPDAATANWSTNVTTPTPSVANVTESSAYVSGTGATANGLYQIHATAEDAIGF